MPSCVLRTCKNSYLATNKSVGVSFHRFLRIGHEKREDWIAFVQKDRRDEYWLPTSRTVICSNHFRESDKYKSKTGRTYLKKMAVPYNGNDEERNIAPGEEPLESVSESESIFDTPRKITLKRKLIKANTARKTLSIKLKKCQNQNYYLKKKNINYKKLVNNLSKKFNFDFDAKNDLLVKAGNAQTGKKICSSKFRRKIYSASERKFALTLNYYSPAAYKFARSSFGNKLPHPRSLANWYSSLNADPGFTEESFRALKLKAGSNASKPLVCGLVFDEIALRKQKIFHCNKKLGAVNFGAGPTEGDNEDETVASQALVFMLVSLNENWKLPIGYFLIAGINAERKANLIKICLMKCHDVGVTVASLTFDGCSANFGAAEILGCKLTDCNNLQTFFPHPSTGDKVCIFLDPCHVIKLVRNNFEKKRILIDNKNNEVKWQYLYHLNKLQENEGLRFGNKLTSRHINFRQQIMKVKLATQLLSKSVADALILCDEVLLSSKFQGSSATVNFITIFNNFFDVMNSRKCNFYGFNRPLDSRNKEKNFTFLDKVKSYVSKLKFKTVSKKVIKHKNNKKIILKISNQRLLDSGCKTGFLGTLICIESLKALYSSLVEEKKILEYISTYRISQDHLELFFGLIRKHGGYNNNPNVVQFRTAYKKTLNHLELRSSFSGNCIPLDNFHILTSSSVNVINNTTTGGTDCDTQDCSFIVQSDKEADNNCQVFSSMLDHESLPYESKLIVGYISGFVSRKLLKILKCETCIDCLTTNSRLLHHALITIKDMGGLVYSSEDVYIICLSTEKVVRDLIKLSGGISLASKYNLNYIIVNSLKQFIDINVFSNLNDHALLQPSTFNHRVHLIRAIIEQYAKVRLYHEAKTDPSVDRKTQRQRLTKLILFSGN